MLTEGAVADFVVTQAQGVTLEVSARLAALGVRHGFTTRLGGVSRGRHASLNLGFSRGDGGERVLENYRLLGRALGFDPDRATATRQVHGADILVLDGSNAGDGILREQRAPCDAIVFDLPGRAAVVFSADCVPILLYDPERRAAAAIHAGWRGTAAGIVRRTVELMAERFGCSPGRMVAAIGPAIGRCCFETGRDVPEAVMAAFGAEYGRFIGMGTIEGKHFVDLKGINRAQLEGCAVPPENIAVHPHCTACMTGRYWSHRRMGDARGVQGAVIAL